MFHNKLDLFSLADCFARKSDIIQDEGEQFDSIRFNSVAVAVAH